MSDPMDDLEIPFIRARDLGDIREPGWLINGILPRGAKCGLFAAPGVGKSFLALDWCMSVAASMEWLGHPTKQGTTLYVAGEGMSGMPSRVAAWMASQDGTDVPRVFFHPRALNLMDGRGLYRFWEELDNRIQPPPSLIVIDTLATAMDGQDENDASLMTKAMNGVEQLIECTRASVVLIHHANKQGGYRGSSAFHGALDVMMELKRDDDDLLLVCRKARDSMPFDQISLRLLEVEDSAVIIAASDDKRVLTETALSMLGVLSDLSPDGTNTLWAKVCHDEVGTSLRSFYRHRARLLDHGFIVKIGTRWALTVKAQEKLGLCQPSATVCHGTDNGTVPQDGAPFRGGASGMAQTKDSTTTEIERGDAYEPEEAEA